MAAKLVEAVDVLATKVDSEEAAKVLMAKPT